MTISIDIFDPSPAPYLRMVTTYTDSLSEAIRFCEIHRDFMTIADNANKPIKIINTVNGVTKLRCEKMVFVIQDLPFDLTTEQQIRQMKFEEEGECRKYKSKLMQAYPDISITMRNDEIQTVIFTEKVGIDTYDPTEVFTQEFLDGIGYKAKDGK